MYFFFFSTYVDQLTDDTKCNVDELKTAMDGRDE